MRGGNNRGAEDGAQGRRQAARLDAPDGECGDPGTATSPIAVPARGRPATSEILQILTKMVKQRQAESAKAFEDGKRPELAAARERRDRHYRRIPAQPDGGGRGEDRHRPRDPRHRPRPACATWGRVMAGAEGEISGPHGLRQGEARLGRGTAAVT